MGATSEKLPGKSIRLRFSLRAFLIVITTFAVWLGIHVRDAKKQRETIQTISDYGGWIRYDYQFGDDGKFDPKSESWVPLSIRKRFGLDLFHFVEEVNFAYNDDDRGRTDNLNSFNSPLECLPHLKRLRKLCLYEKQANDENLKYVGRLTSLEALRIWNAYDVTDKGIAELRECRNLTHVHLSDSQITDESLRTFSQMSKLEGLSLQDNRFSDTGVAQLKSLKRLRSLWVCGKGQLIEDAIEKATSSEAGVEDDKMDEVIAAIVETHTSKITDKSLEFLLELPAFESLGAQNTKVSDAFEKKLKAKFPKCRVFR